MSFTARFCRAWANPLRCVGTRICIRNTVLNCKFKCLSAAVYVCVCVILCYAFDEDFRLILGCILMMTMRTMMFADALSQFSQNNEHNERSHFGLNAFAFCCTRNDTEPKLETEMLA